MKKTGEADMNLRVALLTALATSLVFPSITFADSAWDWNSRRMSAMADITGDGKSESINLQPFVGKDRFGRNHRYYRLTVNGRSIYDSPFAGAAIGFRLANIDKRDSKKEIIVDLPYLGGSDFNGCMIYWFDGRNVRRVTYEPLNGARIKGDGSVLSFEHLGYLTTEIPYKLQSNHTLRRANQKYFPIDFYTSVKVPFPIYSRPGLKRIAMLREGTRVHILKSDLADWLYVRAGKSTYGWMNTRWNNQYRAFGYPAVG